MKLLFSFIVCLLLTINISGQKTEILNGQDKAIAEKFKNEYKKKNYKKFEGKITSEDSLIRFDDKVIFHDKSNKITSLLLKEGLIYPQLLTDYQMENYLEKITDRTQKRFLRLQKDPRAAFEVNYVKLNSITELTFLNPSPKVKRFKTLFRDDKLDKFTLYIIELTNKNAGKETSLEDFIKGSTLTYLQQQN